MGAPPLEDRFAEELLDLVSGRERPRLLVAFSGGLDSTVLLHLLRFHDRIPLELFAAHFDHRMRESSAADAEWARGVCRAWGIPFALGTASVPPRSEAEARDARYAFLFETAGRERVDLIATAHHADDQAETVLFRVLRGTGITGLAGIPRRGRSGLVRPLLPFWRAELEAYAAAHGLRWRTDPTNASLGPARNWIRQRLLPEIEASIAPGARRNLVALAEIAREAESGWRAVVRRAWRDCVREESGALVLDRSRLAGYPPAVAHRLLREALKRLGITLDQAGTRSALQFITDASSGRELHLPDGGRISVQFDEAVLERAGKSGAEDAPVRIPTLDPARPWTGRVQLGGRAYRVRAERASGSDREEDGNARWSARIALSDARFPLLLRGRRPGDRVRTTGGSKSLKKLLIERRVPLRDRARLPVLVDAGGTLLWVAGLGSFAEPPAPDEAALNLAVYDD